MRCVSSEGQGEVRRPWRAASVDVCRDATRNACGVTQAQSLAASDGDTPSKLVQH